MLKFLLAIVATGSLIAYLKSKEQPEQWAEISHGGYFVAPLTDYLQVNLVAQHKNGDFWYSSGRGKTKAKTLRDALNNLNSSYNNHHAYWYWNPPHE